MYVSLLKIVIFESGNGHLHFLSLQTCSSQNKNSNMSLWNKLNPCFYFFIFFVGYRHPSPAIVARTVRILHTLLTLVNKHRNCDKFEVNTQSVAYLAGKKHKLDKIKLILHLYLGNTRNIQIPIYASFS